jgi:hypothetical protein
MPNGMGESFYMHSAHLSRNISRSRRRLGDCSYVMAKLGNTGIRINKDPPDPCPKGKTCFAVNGLDCST